MKYAWQIGESDVVPKRAVDVMSVRFVGRTQVSYCAVPAGKTYARAAAKDRCVVQAGWP